MSDSPAAARSASSTVQVLRALCHLAAVIIITWWAIAEWSFPWPGLLAGAGFLVLTVVLWALFLSPRPMLRTDRFGQGLVELLLIAGAVGALLGLGVHWIIVAAFGLLAAGLGYAAGMKRA